MLDSVSPTSEYKDNYFNTNILNGEYQIESRQQIAVWCENKGLVVTAPMNNDLTTSISNQWQDYFQSGAIGGAFNIVDTISDFKSAWQGVSLHQPYMSRKIWKGTSPLSFNLTLKFVAVSDAKTEVFDKVNSLLSMCVGADLGTFTVEELKAMGLKSPAQKVDNQTVMKEISENSTGVSKIVSTAVSAYYSITDLVTHPWGVPGPNITLDSQKKSARATSFPVSVFIPFFGTLTNCYINNANVTFNRALDYRGYPMSASVDITVNRMDSLVCQKNSQDKYEVNWNYEYESGTLSVIQAIVTALIDGIEQTIDGIPNLVTAVLGKIKGYY